LQEILSKWEEKCRTQDIISLTPLNRVWLSLCQFSRSPKLLNSISSRSAILNFIQIGGEVYKIKTNFTFSFSWSKLVFLRLTNAEKTSHGYLLFRVSTKTANKYEVTHRNLFTSRSKYGYRCADFHETHASLATICEKSYTGFY
jgi:hypothetical protein